MDDLLLVAKTEWKNRKKKNVTLKLLEGEGGVVCKKRMCVCVCKRKCEKKIREC